MPFNELVPPDVYFDTRPEYFSLIDGKRRKGYYQLCLTNPDVLRITIENGVREYDWLLRPVKLPIWAKLAFSKGSG